MLDPTEKTTENPSTTATEAAPASKTRGSKTSAQSRRLSDAQLGEVIAMLDDVDSVEMKLTVPVDSHPATIRGLPIDPVEAELRQIFFFDTPDLTLNKHGLIVRARRTPKGDDSVVKLRPVVPSELSADLRSHKGFGV